MIASRAEPVPAERPCRDENKPSCKRASRVPGCRAGNCRCLKQDFIVRSLPHPASLIVASQITLRSDPAQFKASTQLLDRRRLTCPKMILEGKSLRTGIYDSALAAMLIFGLSACQSESVPGPAASAISQVPATIAPESLVGRWGLASYHNDADKARTTIAARGQCKQPYVISKGKSGGVVTLLADDPEPQEVFVKGASGGKNFLGPAGPPGDFAGSRDRLVRQQHGCHAVGRSGGCAPLRDDGPGPLREGLTLPRSNRAQQIAVGRRETIIS